MKGFTLTESEAWAAIHRPFTPPRYLHRVAANTVKRQRESWLRRVERNADTGCWTWTGPMMVRKGSRVPMPIYYVRNNVLHTTTSSAPSALWWAINEWFRPLGIKTHMTASTCKNYRCVNPCHRAETVSRVSSAFRELTDADIQCIAGQRYDRSMRSLAEEFGISKERVRRIWQRAEREHLAPLNSTMIE